MQEGEGSNAGTDQGTIPARVLARQRGSPGFDRPGECLSLRTETTKSAKARRVVKLATDGPAANGATDGHYCQITAGGLHCPRSCETMAPRRRTAGQEPNMKQLLLVHTTVGQFSRTTASAYTCVVVWRSPRPGRPEARGSGRQRPLPPAGAAQGSAPCCSAAARSHRLRDPQPGPAGLMGACHDRLLKPLALQGTLA
jgi:hypothetical protein